MDRTKREPGVVKPLGAGVVNPLIEVLAEALALCERVGKRVLGVEARCSVERWISHRGGPFDILGCNISHGLISSVICVFGIATVRHCCG